jgi:hypothetical protein
MEVKPVKIFTLHDVPRLRYIADLILNGILGLAWEIITDKRKIGKSPVINYSDENIPGSFRIVPVTLLFEAGLKEQAISVDSWKGLPVFFKSAEEADLPFDVFAASFYLVARYEEYADYETDEYGRFKSSGSLAFRNNFLHIPVVDLWAKELAKSLVKKFQTLTFKRSEYRALTTFDIDEPFAFLGKTLLGNIGGFLHDFASGSKKTGHRLVCLTGGEKDPYEVFDYITELTEKNKTATKFFFPVGNNSDFDKNPSWKNDDYRNLIRNIAGKSDVGLHPSFKASTDISLLKTELKRLSTILNRESYISRFHFLKIVQPFSNRNILKCGITEDYSMGHSDEPGFRAGIARPFRFYDVIEDIRTDLLIFPFQVMDITLSGYKKLNADEAKKLIGELIFQTKRAGGLFVSIWHNTSLLDTPDCRKWREVFEFTLMEQSP